MLLSFACPARLKPKHPVLTARLPQPRLLQQHWWAVLRLPHVRLRPEHTCVQSATFSAPNAKKLCREARGKALLSANCKALRTSLAGKALHNRAKFTSKGRTKSITSPCEATPSGEAIWALLFFCHPEDAAFLGRSDYSCHLKSQSPSDSDDKVKFPELQIG